MKPPKPTIKHFRTRLEKHETSEATAIIIPFDIEEAFGARARVAVRGTINGFPFRSSLFTMGGRTFMPVNQELRTGAKARGGDTVSIVMQRDDEPRTVEPPPDFARALRANKTAKAVWDKLSYTHRKEHVKAIEDAKKPETRQRRIEKAISLLAAGQKEPH